MRKIALGPLTFLSWAAGIVLTAAVTWLKIVSWQEIQIPFVVMFLGGIVVMLLTSKLSITKETVWNGKIVMAIAAGLAVLIAQTLFLQQFFSYAITSYDNVLLGALFAIYEETIMLGFSALLVAAGIPDAYNVILSTLFFVPMHALVYPAMLFFDLFLTGGRVVMTSALLATDNSDTSYAIHLIWNVVNSL